MKFSPGFTVVEMIIVIAVISILTVISIVAWDSWENSMARSNLESELSAVSTAMDQHQNFNNSYPTSLPVAYKQGQNVSVVYKSGNAGSYCIEAKSSNRPGLVFKSSSGNISEGAC